jgi:phosphoribosylglycinamide formyltransferase 1
VSLPTAVFVSGGGSNLQALLDRFASGGAARIALVITDRQGAGALQRAAAAGVPALHIPTGGRGVDEVAQETLAALHRYDIELVALAGYLRLVPAAVTRAYRDRILNIHPALLPAFGGRGMYGRRVHEAVLAAGCRVSGATVHCVDERYDEGRIIAQWPVPVLPGDDASTLAARVLHVEHRLYPAAVEAVAAHRGGVAVQRGYRAGGADVFRLGQLDESLETEIIDLSGL